ncbi:hypothetical protein EB14_02288 [Enterococcus faecium]|nr:DUF1140 family protein [Enterococcus faecium]RBS30844.1 hypothetical protein EB14_02288 [Enterococcus faecium]
MDLITQYSDIILKKIMMKIQKDKKSKERAELVKLEMAYNEIKGRTGKMVDGVFVKSSDLEDSE